MDRETGERQGWIEPPKRGAEEPPESIEEPPRNWQEYYAIARYDLGLSMEEFGEMVPSMFFELRKRRVVYIRHIRYASAMSAAMVYNVNRPEDAEPLTAFDFVRIETEEWRAKKQLEMNLRSLERFMQRPDQRAPKQAWSPICGPIKANNGS